jgi:hypothetical protein
MRPPTLAKTAERVAAGEPLDKALAEFLDGFYAAPDMASAFAKLADEPSDTGERNTDALLAAVADYLARQYLHRSPPAWTFAQKRIALEPVFSGTAPTAAMKEWQTHHSPAEFKCRNIFAEDRPLRRKMSDRPAFAERPASIDGSSSSLEN